MLKKKIISVLNGHQYSHSQAGYLSTDEAQAKFLFFIQFYGVNDQTIEFESEYITYEQFADAIFNILADNLFVKHQND